ncbi:Two-component system protein B [Aspergillus navahoensis]
MRVPIAVQLGLLVLVTALAGLAALAIATWINNYNFVVDVKSQSLELVATIKSSQIASNLDLLETTCKTIITRILVQSALKRYYAGNTTKENFATSITDVQSALGSRGYLTLYQASIYARGVDNGETTARRLLNVTSDEIPQIRLPYDQPNGTAVMLGDEGLGYPPSLYPNLTKDATTNEVYAFGNVSVTMNQPLLLGPLVTNDSFSLISLSLPIINNTSAADILGYITVVASATNLQDVISSRQGLGNTGQALLLAPARPENRFPTGSRPATATSEPQIAGLDDQEVRYVFRPTPLPGNKRRHSPAITSGASFPLRDYPIALDVLSQPYDSINHSITDLSSKNENGTHVAVGAIQQRSSLVEWVLIIEENHGEAFAPVSRLRKIILACVFGTAGVIALLVLPLAHLSVAPIRRLREATRKSVNPTVGSMGPSLSTVVDPTEVAMQNSNEKSEKGGFFSWLKWDRGDSATGRHRDHEPHQFQIPGRVKERKHIITDELTDLTSTFNEMSDELVIQYNRLEERVAERTRELEKAKIAAETANESKTLFIANISHELKTPLNGILGMCAVCMGEDDLPRIKKSLQTVYKSGDLLLHLLNDLLTFSRNQVDQAIRLEEKEFKLSDIRSQLRIIFQNQVQEKQISFSIKFCHPDTPRINESTEAASRTAGPVLGPPGTAKLKDMVLWGDQHRILQILINLVSNSLKFTPEEGTVAVRIKCLGEEHTRPTSPRPKSRALSHWRSLGSSHGSSRSKPSLDHPRDGGDEDTMRPPNLRTLILQFEVEDTGPGIPRHLQDRVFEPFVQGDLRLNRKYGGTGLGLSICSQLAKLMRGQIQLDSDQGRGTLFSVRIPLGFVKESPPSTASSTTSLAGSRTSSVFSLDDLASVAKAPSHHSDASQLESTKSNAEKQDSQPRLVGLSQPFFAPPVRPAEDNGPRKIRALVAEDNVVNQEVVLRMLALEHVYDVTVVKDGQEAYDTVKANMEEGKVFDLIFMDIQMPNLDGIESTRLIRQMGYSAPIVALSAFSEDSNIKDCMNSGMDMFISKPIRRPALKQVLRRFTPIPEEAEKPQM